MEIRPETLPLAARELHLEPHERAYNQRWLQHFRMTYEGFQYIKKEIAPLVRHPGNPIGGPKPLSPGEQLCIALWWLAQGGEYRAIATGAGRCRASVHRCVVRVCRAINKVLGPKHIKFPSTAIELENAAKAFEALGRGRVDANGGTLRGLVQVIGAVDGSHIPIFRPPGTTDEYINRKKFYSLLLQGVVDAGGRFIDVFTFKDSRFAVVSGVATGAGTPAGPAAADDAAAPTGQQVHHDWLAASALCAGGGQRLCRQPVCGARLQGVCQSQ